MTTTRSLPKALSLFLTALVAAVSVMAILYVVAWSSDSFAYTLGPVPTSAPEATERRNQLRDLAVLSGTYGVAALFLVPYAVVIAIVQSALTRAQGLPWQLHRVQFLVAAAVAGGVAGAVEFIGTIGFCKAGCIGDRFYSAASHSLGLGQLAIGVGFLSLPIVVAIAGALLARLRTPTAL